MPTPKRDWIVRDAIVPFTFKRGRCFLCDAPAVTRVADEPMCALHRDRVASIRRDAEAATPDLFPRPAA